MRFSLQEQYAICGLFDLALSSGEGPQPIDRIGERQAIPTRYLEQIFQRLRRAGLIESKRGPGGGYRLARPAAEIRLLEIVEAVAGSLATSFDMEDPGGEGSDATQRPGFLWPLLADRMQGVLASLSLEDLVREGLRRGIARRASAAPMYFI